MSSDAGAGIWRAGEEDEYHSAVEPNHSEAQTVKVDLMIRDKSGVTAAGVMAMHAPNIIRAFFRGGENVAYRIAA